MVKAKSIQINRTSTISVSALFELLYCVNLVAMLLMRVYGSGILSKVRYVYLGLTAILLIFTMFHDREKSVNTAYYVTEPIKQLLPFILHTVLFCLVFTNDFITSYTNDYFQELAIYISSIILTVFFVLRYVTVDKILKLSFWCFGFFMFYCYITNFNGLAPFRYLSTLFGTTNRVRFLFGLQSAVEAGMYAGVTLILSIYLLFIKKEYSFRKITLSLIIHLVIDFSMVLVLLSTAARGAIVEVLMFAFLALFYSVGKKIHLKLNKKLLIFIVLSLLVIFIVCFFAFNWYVTLWELSGSRMSNYTDNLAVFERYANSWIGLGYASHSIYLNQGFGYSTSALDILYLYVYFSTGIIGFVLFIWQLVILAKNIFKPTKEKTEIDFFVKSIFLIMLFDGFFEVSFINPSLISNYIYMVMIVAYIVEKKLKQRKNTSVLKVLL